MPGPLKTGHKLHDFTGSGNKKVGAYLQIPDGFKIGILRYGKTTGKKAFHIAAPELSGRQRNVVDYQKTDLPLRPPVKVCASDNSRPLHPAVSY